MPQTVAWACVCATLVAGLSSAGFLWRTGSTAASEDRAVFRSSAAGTALLTIFSVLLLLGLPDAAFWFFCRPLVLVALLVTSIKARRVRRTDRPLFDVLITGWMVTGGVILLTWLALTMQPWVERAPSIGGPGLWLLINGVWLSLLAGLLTRASRDHGAFLILLFLSAFVGYLGDMVAIVLGRAVLGIPGWLLCGVLVAVAARRGGLEVLRSVEGFDDMPTTIQWYLMPFVPAAVYLLMPGERDGVSRFIAGSVVGALMITVVRNSSQNEHLWDELNERTRGYQRVLADSRDVIVELDRAGTITYASPASADVLGIPPRDLVGSLLQSRIHPDDLAGNLDATRSAMTVRNAGPVQVQVSRFNMADRDWRDIEWTINWRPGEERLVLSGRDISERIRLASELAQQARVDSLTGLLNRGAFLGVVDARLKARSDAVLLMIDLDHFKAVNDTLGHAEGDLLLTEISQRLRSAVPAPASIARLGGDEFAVLLSEGSAVEARQIAAAIIANIHAFEEAHRDRPRVSASIGIAVGHDLAAAELLRNADLAMYRAKADGRDTHVVFESWMSERAIEESRLYSELESAIENDRLTIHLQPIVSLTDESWHKFEALVRWRDGTTLRPPSEFLPLAESSGLIVPLGTWVLHEALTQLATWPDPAVGVAVNVSPRQLEDPAFVDVVRQALEATGVPPERLTLEITEQTAVADLNTTASRLARLQASGVHVAIDDFGTGFSSMRYLTRLPIDTLKIDQQFVAGIGVRSEDEVLVLSMIRLATDLRLLTVAEGVETSEQAEFLLRHGCSLGQGYYFSPPRDLTVLRAIRDELGLASLRT